MSAATDFVMEDFSPVIRNTLVGFARVRMPSAMILHDVAILNSIRPRNRSHYSPI